MQKFQRFTADQRWDLPQYNNMKLLIEEEFQAYAKFFITPTAKIVQNWQVENAGGLTVRVNQTTDSTLFATERVGKEDFHRHLTTDDVIDLVLPDNILSYVEVQIFEKTCAEDTVAKWDTTANGGVGAQTTQTVDTVTAQDFRLVSNTIAFSGDPDKLPLAEVTTSGGVITLITDSRDFLFDSGTYSFGAPRTDIGIGNIKEMYDAITTIIQEFKGSAEWYDEFGTGLSNFGLLERFNYILTDGGDVSWENPNANELVFSADLKIRVPHRAFDYTISAQTVTIASDEVAYVTLPDVGVTPGGPLAVSVIANGSYLLDGTNTRNYILAYRSPVGGKLFFGNGWQGVELESGEITQLGDGITDALLTATGLTDENDDTPPYTSTNIITTDASFTTTISELDAEVERPLRLLATEPTEDAKLNFIPSQVKRSDGTGRSVPDTNGAVPSFVASNIDFQAKTTAGGTFDITFPASTVGQFRRCGFTLQPNGTLKAIFSAEAGSVGALADPGTLFVLGFHVGWIDLECTDVSGEFKTAGSATNIIENEVSGTSRIVVSPRATDITPTDLFDLNDENFGNYVIPADSNRGAGNTDLTDSASTNPRGLSLADLKVSHGVEYIYVNKVMRNGNYDSNGLPEWEIVSPKPDSRVRFYGWGWSTSFDNRGARVTSNGAIGNYIVVTGVFDSFGSLVNFTSSQTNDIDVLVDGSDTGVNLSQVGDESNEDSGYGYNSILSDDTLKGLGFDLHTVKLVNNTTAFMNCYGFVLVGNGDVNEVAGNAFVAGEKTDYSEALAVALPTINSLKGSRIVRYIDPIDQLKKWATRDVKDINTTVGAITATTTALTMTSTTGFLANDILLLEDGTNQELIQVSSVDNGTDITTVSSAVNTFTTATVSLYARVLTDIDHEAFDEEPLDEFHFREFGYRDTTSPGTSPIGTTQNMVGILQDHVHALHGESLNVIDYGSIFIESLNNNGLNAAARFGFYGCGLDILFATDNILTGTVDVFIDDIPVSIGSLANTVDSLKWQAVVAGLPMGWHTVKLLKSVANEEIGIVKFKTYQPKPPSAVSALAEGLLLSDLNHTPTTYLFRGANPASVSRGVHYEAPSRHAKFSNEGSAGGTLNWAMSVVDEDLLFGRLVSTDRNNAYVERWFYGSGVEIVSRFASFAGIWLIEVDGLAATTANFPGSQGDGYNGTTGEINMYSASLAQGKKVSIPVTEGWHKIKITNTNAKDGASSGFFCTLEAWGIIGPGWSGRIYDHNEPVGLANYAEGTKKDIRQLTPTKEFEDPSFSALSTLTTSITATTPTPLREAMGVINMRKPGTVFINFDGSVQALGGALQGAARISINSDIPSASGPFSFRENMNDVSAFEVISKTAQIRVPAGKHHIMIKTDTSANTFRFTSDYFTLKVTAKLDK